MRRTCDDTRPVARQFLSCLPRGRQHMKPVCSRQGNTRGCRILRNDHHLWPRLSHREITWHHVGCRCRRNGFKHLSGGPHLRRGTRCQAQNKASINRVIGLSYMTHQCSRRLLAKTSNIQPNPKLCQARHRGKSFVTEPCEMNLTKPNLIGLHDD